MAFWSRGKEDKQKPQTTEREQQPPGAFKLPPIMQLSQAMSAAGVTFEACFPGKDTYTYSNPSPEFIAALQKRGLKEHNDNQPGHYRIVPGKGLIVKQTVMHQVFKVDPPEIIGPTL